MPRAFRVLTTGAFACLLCGRASAELQNVEVGGVIEVSATYYSEFFESAPSIRIPPEMLPLRPIGPYGTASNLRTDGHGHGCRYVEQRTRLNARADFTDQVAAFIELESIDMWGQDFRSDYLTGLDFRAVGGDDVEVYQAYIEAERLAGLPLRMRIGRQEIVLGSGWLVGANPDCNPFTGLSFDALRLTATAGDFALDAWCGKLFEGFADEEDGDADFAGLYASYGGWPDTRLDAYWMLVRDARSLNDTNGDWASETLEQILGLDDYDPTYLHTAGLRFSGTRGAWDWDAEAAFQFGNADAVGALFKRGAYGDDSAEWSAWGGHAHLGYTFDAAWEPRVGLSAEYYSGEDDRDVSLADWLNPFADTHSSVSFNRLFSDHEIDAFLCGSALSNVWMAGAEVEASPADAFTFGATLSYQEAIEPFRAPWSVSLRRWRIPVDPQFPFLDQAGARDLGWQAGIWADYAYSEDLSFYVGWTRLFVGEGLADGAFLDENGLRFMGGRGDSDADYCYFCSKLEF